VIVFLGAISKHSTYFIFKYAYVHILYIEGRNVHQGYCTDSSRTPSTLTLMSLVGAALLYYIQSVESVCGTPNPRGRYTGHSSIRGHGKAACMSFYI
jgi:hypothetical protein